MCNIKTDVMPRNRMTIQQVRDLSKKHKYVILRQYDGTLYGCNTAVLNLSKNKERHGNSKSIFVSYKPCNLNEYISKKIRFIPIKTN